MDNKESKVNKENKKKVNNNLKPNNNKFTDKTATIKSNDVEEKLFLNLIVFWLYYT